ALRRPEGTRPLHHPARTVRTAAAAAARTAYGQGPATITAGLMRQELEELNRGGAVARFFNHPLTLLLMLAACVGLIVYGFARKRPGPEELYAAAAPLMASDRPADWQRAWADYLEPLQERYPNSYRDEVKAFRRRLDDLQ